MGDGAVLLQEERNGAGPAEYYLKKIKHHQKTFSTHRGQAIVSPDGVYTCRIVMLRREYKR